eukprot:GHVH01002063.1.p1 GENE.GHVH01002063.1~~GHVH01002063.1.p1  ORF type:complete len:101 (+),score=7.35 GHVH01002063.1:40-342(+)
MAATPELPLVAKMLNHEMRVKLVPDQSQNFTISSGTKSMTVRIRPKPGPGCTLHLNKPIQGVQVGAPTSHASSDKVITTKTTCDNKGNVITTTTTKLVNV